MARSARIVIPDFPHHVIQRGVRRMNVFNQQSDYYLYMSLIVEGCKKAGTEILAYCLMPNHVHFVMVPDNVDGLRAAVSNAHRKYTRIINQRTNCTGHLWQDRFLSFPMDESYLLSCVKYIELNPVRAGLVDDPLQWEWSSAKAHIRGENDLLVKVKTMLDLVPDWKSYLEAGISESNVNKFNKQILSGFPMGDDNWIDSLENNLEKRLRSKRRGRKKLIRDSN